MEQKLALPSRQELERDWRPIHALALELLATVRDHYARRAFGPHLVRFEALDALAFTVASTLLPVLKDEPFAGREWFDAALDAAIARYVAEDNERKGAR